MIVGKYSIESDALNVTVYEISEVKDKDSKNFGKKLKKLLDIFLLCIKHISLLLIEK